MKYTVGDSDIYGYNHYLYGEAFLGSFKGMRFRLGREPLKKVIFLPESEWGKDGEGEAFFLATVWPEPWSFEKRDMEKTEEERFPFSEEGLKEAVKWLELKCGNEYEGR